MKKIITWIMLCMLVFTPMEAESHPGRLDKYGGHMNHKTGEYHYHRGSKSVSKSRRSTKRRRATRQTRRTRRSRSRSRR